MEDPKVRERPQIVVGVDDSACSAKALKWDAKLAPQLDAVIVAVTTWHFETSWGAYALPCWNPEADAQQILADVLAEAFGEHTPEGLVGKCFQGQPAQVLIEQNKSAVMLVVGSRCHGGFAGLLLGSGSSACTEHSACPILVVHPATTAPEAGGTGHETNHGPVGRP
ncbi:universal stress protein [Paeniglutamicibacter kerguelensis]|uniref:Nucleotide-binding universal stress UspA family protein n=1 Tax=Paeniglutamicibacter kerguelensis TaxID=254788 RepID=A0ABS4XCT3_9MICC|nr:universal stress protein [Paeniglutamicibacter kerguelensis]MBP2386275.1 nucleotide-binding universal stress UspA family protein [Paeniglutamicibacter kerguelensis]